MDGSWRKRDRTARLLKLQVILWQYPQGIKVNDIARKCDISERTVYRDLKALETELDVPIWEEGSRRGIVEGYFLPPISFTPMEAMNIFLAVRAMQAMSNQCSSDIISTFMKLNTVMPPTLKKRVQDTLDYIEKYPKKNKTKIKNFEKLAEAWLSQHRVRIRFQDITGEEPVEQVIEPYFIEPAALSRSSYVIAHSPLKRDVLTYKIDRIIGEVHIEPETYEIPSDFNVIDYLDSVWGSYRDMEARTVRLHFNKIISKSIMETEWHPSQKIKEQPDGSIIMTLRIRPTRDFRAWVLGWGNMVEVLEPEILRKQITEIIESMKKIYS
ncbi:MAG: WYL domain-containing transcriptional regulator [Deltaproteobacteria bacterium]|nr:WYL domain-containing transcriptional regulator [Deltaproteobacteria bacterium]